MKKRGLKLIIAALAVTIIGGAFVGCSSKSDGSDNDSGTSTGGSKPVTITVSGSTSVGPLMEKEAEVFQGKNKNIKVEIQQIGSSAGIKNAIQGVSELGMSSRELKDEEKSQIKEEIIAYDGIALVVNPKNTVTNLTMEQLKGIYTGKITNWKEVGGKDSPIVVVSREDGSGTRSAFEELVGFKGEDMIQTASISQGNGAVKNTVVTNENAIGYLSFELLYKEDGSLDDTIKASKIENIDPTADNVLNKTYKLSRPFIVVYKEDKISAESKQFIEFIKSEEGQQIAKSKGAIPLK